MTPPEQQRPFQERQLAEQGDAAGPKVYAEVHDVDDAARTQLTEILGGTPQATTKKEALLAADKKTSKKTPPNFRYNAENKLIEITADGITLANGTEVLLTAPGESSIKGRDGKGATIPIGTYVIEIKPDKNGREMPTLKPLDPSDRGGNYTIDFWKTDFNLAQQKSIIKKANAVRQKNKTNTHIENGKKTWTTAQSVRDSLQNHLDAQTQHYFNYIVSTVLDTNQLQSSNLTEEQQDHLNEFCYALFRYAKSWQDLSFEAKKEFQSALEESGRELPINKAYMSGSSINLHALESALTSIDEVRPTMRYRVVDIRHKESPDIWVTLEQLQQPPYNEMTQTSEGEELRFQITAIDIADQGSGFDAKLTKFYISTKAEAQHLRGKFGEGVKMNYAHLLRNGAKVKMRSRYSIEGEAREGRIWQRRPYIDEDSKISFKSIEVQLPPDTEKVSGSSTLIDIVGAKPEFQEAFRKNINPRNPEGLAINCLAYNPYKYYYPVSKMYIGNSEPETFASMGVSLENDPKYQYLQGLRIEGGEDHMKCLFSYDVLDKTLLQGRDRSQFNDEVRSRIHNFWYQAESPVLLEALVKRALVDLQRNDSESILETNALRLMMENTYLKNPQQERTQAKLYEVLPGILGLQVDEKHVVVSNNDAASEENAHLLRILENKGYKIIYVGGRMQGRVFERANKFYDGKYHLYTLDAAREKVQESTTFLSPDHKDVIRTKPVVDAAKSELGGLLTQAGISHAQGEMIDVQYLETIDPEVEKPVEAVFDEKTKTFHIIVRPDLMLTKTENGQGMAYWKRRIQIEMLSTIHRSEAFPDRTTGLQHAQKFADLLVEKTLHENAPDMRAVPETFHHVIDPSKEKGAMDMLYETPEALHNSIRGWHAYEQVSKFECTLNELQQVSDDLKSISPYYRSQIEKILTNRIVVENGDVGYFTSEYSDEDKADSYTFHREKISTLEPVGQLDGDDVYRVGGKIFMPFKTPMVEGSVVTDELSSRKYLYHNGELLHYDLENEYNPQFERANMNDDGWYLHNGCFSLSVESRAGGAQIDDLKSALDHLKFEPPESGKTLEMKTLEGTVETDLPVEYGKDEWDNPVRFFQDILQNHIDASPDSKVETLFEVLRDDKRIWITGAELTDTSDRIVGFRVRDNGGGYPPDDLGTMGKSSKKSPLFAGKYGEGQKMLAAAAARKGFDLRFSSVGNYKGAQQRWVAAVGTQTEQFVEDGEKKTAEIVVFTIKNQRPSVEERYSSETILRLPEGSERSVDSELQKWFSIIDPRNTDERGNGGLGRYIINLREGDNSNVIDLGYMRILLDEPGAVYENGLLIGNDPQKNALGYDVPEVVTTRERNAWSKERLRAYVLHALEHSTDPRFIDTLVKELKARYLKDMTSGGEAMVSESDLNVGKIFQSKEFIASRPYWRDAFASHFPGYFVHSDEHMDTKILAMEYKSRVGNTVEVENARLCINDANMVVANMGHIPQDKILRVYQHDYEGYAKVLPAAEEYLRTIARQEVSVSDEVLGQLRGIVAASAKEIQQTIDLIGARENVKLRSIVSSNEPSTKMPVEATKELARLREQLNFWTSTEQLAATPHSLFVAPSYSGYHGVAEPRSIGINENLLLPENRQKLVETIRHELLHSLTGLHDYTPEFVMLLLELADQNRRTPPLSPSQPRQGPRQGPPPPPPLRRG